MRTIFVLLLLIFCNAYAVAEQDPVIVHNGGAVGDRPIDPTNVDMPHVFYDNETQEIILYGAGVVSYYDVEISSASSGYVEISTVVNGTYDTIDVSSLPTGTHVITIESPTGNIYEGTFSTY